MSEKTKTVQIKWEGRGRRLLGTADGLSRDYDWPAHGAAIDVTHEDAPKVMLLARASNMAYVNPVEGETLAQEADAMTAPDSEPEMVKATEPEATPDAADKEPAKADAAGAQEKSEAKPKRNTRRKSQA